ncbi:hypothetical protein LPJ66_000433 [Kickxella alabastrina]|uniref:Uncharacterized protein n=1 Tax=Kickxella alabastrina TaxID=61397 RepID=A0ACC1IW15_9FUNG|nr:hypothetical protein LPJ66_000433 [Kickxella alabastrina]
MESHDESTVYPQQPADIHTGDTTVLTNHAILELTSKHIHVYKVEITNLDARSNQTTNDTGTDNRQVKETDLRQDIFKKAFKDTLLVFDSSDYAYSSKNLHKKWPTIMENKNSSTAELARTVTHDGHDFRVILRHLRTYERKVLLQHCQQANSNTEGKKGDEVVGDGYIQGMLFALDSIVRSSLRVFEDLDGHQVDSSNSIATDRGFDIWWIHRLAVRPGCNHLYLNISTRGAPISNQPNLYALAQQLLGSAQNLTQQRGGWWPGFELTIRGLRVLTPEATQPVQVRSLTRNTMHSCTINGESLAEHYQKTYGLDAGNPGIPCVVTASGATVPLVHCRLAHRQRLGILEGGALRAIMGATVMPPQWRVQVLRAVLLKLGDKAQNKGLSRLADMGIKIHTEPAHFPATQLQEPKLLAQNSRPVRIQGSGRSWTLGPQQQQQQQKGGNDGSALGVYTGGQLYSWAVLLLAPQVAQAQAQQLVAQLTKVCAELGIAVHNPRPPIHRCAPQANLAQAMQQAISLAATTAGGKVPCQLLLCVLPSTSTALYGEVKRLAYTQLGVQTQCLQASHLLRAHTPRLLGMLALKINLKLGGTTTRLDTPLLSDQPNSVPTMIISADVSHTTEAGGMSVAAVVASMDLCAGGGRFHGTVLQQPEKLEYIENFDTVMRHALRVFYRETGGRKPERIIYYRDGVNDKQMAVVKQLELQAMYRGCALVDPQYRPRITLILARKRHHARFLPGGDSEAGGAGDEAGGTRVLANCPPGTVVTAGVCHPGISSFFLLSHQSVHGVSKPTYYVVAHDDSQLEPEALRTLTYHLSYAYGITMRPVTMPASLYYAHRLTGKGRLQLNHAFDELPRFSRASGAGSAKALKRQQAKREYHLVKVHENLRNTMYFM